MDNIDCKQCVKLLDENGRLKRGQELQRSENKRKAEKIKKQYEELQKQETQINLLTDQVEKMSEDGADSIFIDSQRDERDMIIADEVSEMQKYLYQNNTLSEGDPLDIGLDKIIKQLKGSE